MRISNEVVSVQTNRTVNLCGELLMLLFDREAPLVASLGMKSCRRVPGFLMLALPAPQYVVQLVFIPGTLK